VNLPQLFHVILKFLGLFSIAGNCIDFFKHIQAVLDNIWLFNNAFNQVSDSFEESKQKLSELWIVVLQVFNIKVELHILFKLGRFIPVDKNA
jgi:hypothetical protein